MREGPIAGYQGTVGRGRRGQEGKEGWVHESEGMRVPWEGQTCREGRLVQSADPRSTSFPDFLGLLPLTSVHPWPAEGVGGPFWAIRSAGLSLPSPRGRANVAAMVGWRVRPAVPPSPSPLSCPVV